MAIKWKDLKHKSSPEERDKIKREAVDELQRMGLGKLRQARAQTQVALAERLDIPQGAVSRLERRTDLLIGTMRQYVEGLGGRLELRAIFDDGVFVIETFSEERKPQRHSVGRHRATGTFGNTGTTGEEAISGKIRRGVQEVHIGKR